MLATSHLYSQKVILNEKGDTSVIFSLNQSRYLLKAVYKVNELDSLNEICEHQNRLHDSIHVFDNKIIANDSIIHKNDTTAISLKQYEVDKEKSKRLEAEKATKRQKVYKWVIVTAEAIKDGFLVYLYIKHE